MENFVKILLAIHISAGFLALVAGPLAAIYRKNVAAHRKAGISYFYSMLIVFFSSIFLSIFKENIFLFLIAVFSFNFAWTGLRSIRIMKFGVRKMDHFTAYISLSFNFLLLVLAAFLFYKNSIEMAILSFVFGLIGMITTWRWRMKLLGESNRNNWLIQHITAMGGAYIATFTAFSATNFFFLPGILRWLLPTIIGSIILSMYLSKVRKLKRVV